MNITFVSADDTIRMTFGIDPWSAVTDLTKIEKKLGKDLTDIIQKAIDVAFNVTSQTFTRGPKDAYIVSYSWELHPVYEGRVVEHNTVKSISVTVGDSDHSLYEFEDVEDRDVDAMITWLRKEHQVYYTPNNELLNEKKKWAEKVAKQQKKIDSYEATLSEITDIMKPKYAGPAWSETWDDLVERIKRMKEKVETLEAAKTYWRDSFEKAQDSRSAFCKKLKEALDVDYRYPGSFPKMEEDILAEIKRLKMKAAANDFHVESEWEADYRAFVQRIFEALGTPCVDEVVHPNYLALQALEAVKELKVGHDDARGLSLKIEELEEKLKFAKQAENWHIRTNQELVMERDKYRNTCEELKQDVYEWEDRFDKICEELDTTERDFDEVFDELRKNLNELDKLAEFKAKLAEVIKLPEDKKHTATTEDYISSFEHTKKEWRRMEIKLENYEREIRLLNAFLDEKKKELGASNGAMEVLRNLYTHVKGQEPPLNSTPSAIAAVCKYEFNTLQTMKKDYTNAKCARAELAWVYKEVLDVDRLDLSLSPHEIAVRIRRHVDVSFRNGCKYLKRMRELEQKLEDIKAICDGNTDVMNIIG